MTLREKLQYPCGGGGHAHLNFHHGIGPFDAMRWWRNAGWNAGIAGRPRHSPFIIKTSPEHDAWCEGYDTAQEMLLSQKKQYAGGHSDE